MATSMSTSCPDLTAEFTVPLFEEVVAAALSPAAERAKEAEAALLRFKTHPDALLRVDAILSGSQSSAARFVAVQILEENVRVRWRLLTKEARASVRMFVFTSVTSTTSLSDDPLVQRRLNTVLVEIAKRDWPEHWPTFVPDLLLRAQSTTQAVARNVLEILRSLNEEIFSERRILTTARRRRLRNALCSEYVAIFSLVDSVLKFSEEQGDDIDDELLRTTLYAFRSFCNSMPVSFLFTTGVITRLLGQLNSPHSVAALDCLAEVAELRLVSPPPSSQDQASLYAGACERVAEMQAGICEFLDLYLKKFSSSFSASSSSSSSSARSSSSSLERSFSFLSEEERDFVRRLARALGALCEHRRAEMNTERSLLSFQRLVLLTRVEDSALFADSVFPAWSSLIDELYAEYPLRVSISRPLPRRQSFSAVLRAVFPDFVRNMVRPDEVFVRVNDIGEVVKDRRVETSETAMYRRLKDALYKLSFVIGEHMRSYLDSSLSAYLKVQASVSLSADARFSKLCWVVGALGNAFEEKEERAFFVAIIKTLLSICELRTARADKAVVASNIMFVIGQYPRFLAYNTEFLAVVARKLFEFMNEDFEGIQEMACDNFLRICEACPDSFFSPFPFSPAGGASFAHGKPSASTALLLDTLVEELPSATASLAPVLQRQVLEAILTVIASRARRRGCSAADFQRFQRSVAKLYEYLADTSVLVAAASQDNVAVLGATLGSSDSGAAQQQDEQLLKALVHSLEALALGMRTLPAFVVSLANIGACCRLMEQLGLNSQSRSASVARNALSAVLVACCDGVVQDCASWPVSSFGSSGSEADSPSEFANAVIDRIYRSLLVAVSSASAGDSNVARSFGPEAGPLLDVAAAIVRAGNAVLGAASSSAAAVSFLASVRATVSVRMRAIGAGLLVPALPLVADADAAPEAARSALRLVAAMLSCRSTASAAAGSGESGGCEAAAPLLFNGAARRAVVSSMVAALGSVWEVSQIALEILGDMAARCFESGIVEFFEDHTLAIIENLLGLVLDCDMRKTFEAQSALLFKMVRWCEASNRLDMREASQKSDDVQKFVDSTLARAFPNVTQHARQSFVAGLFGIRNIDSFRAHLDDFRIKVAEYTDDADAADEDAVLAERLAAGSATLSSSESAGQAAMNGNQGEWRPVS